MAAAHAALAILGWPPAARRTRKLTYNLEQPQDCSNVLEAWQEALRIWGPQRGLRFGVTVSES